MSRPLVLRLLIVIAAAAVFTADAALLLVVGVFCVRPLAYRHPALDMPTLDRSYHTLYL